MEPYGPLQSKLHFLDLLDFPDFQDPRGSRSPEDAFEGFKGTFEGAKLPFMGPNGSNSEPTGDLRVHTARAGPTIKVL